ncbi:putative methyltransferase DDB_G0268948 [Galendromus occidentalis]|uniref:Methyltransferase DDB_G0268948 n=1 Tax=Galendromus occidentalis TaxID=34638 RepID=A0AAJ6QPT6_9ACAR|nr:putative methyltransferase DDB_G0268948 [Galendromus occidentalis]
MIKAIPGWTLSGGLRGVRRCVGERSMSEFVFRTAEHAELYSKFRPSPPTELLHRIVSCASSRESLLDVGCGSGQCTELMAEHFKRVVGCDNSRAQIEQAEARRTEKKLLNVEYKLSSVGNMIFGAGSFDVITASQCVHWFDVGEFYSEAHRVLRKNGLLAMFGYCVPLPVSGVSEIDSAIETRIMRLYRSDLGPFWETDRSLIDSCYRTLRKPGRGFEPLLQELAIHQKRPTDLDGYIQYLATWSSFQKFKKKNPDADLLGELKSDLRNLLRDVRGLGSDKDINLYMDTNFFLHIYKKRDPV